MSAIKSHYIVLKRSFRLGVIPSPRVGRSVDSSPVISTDIQSKEDGNINSSRCVARVYPVFFLISFCLHSLLCVSHCKRLPLGGRSQKTLLSRLYFS